MRYLIDTHTFLWFSDGSPKLSHEARALITNKSNAIFLSIVSLWEISIKTSLGKLEIAGSYELVIEDVTRNGIEVLPLSFTHTVKQNQLAFHHRDPFDRMIVSQALVENMSLISRDEHFDLYLLDKPIQRVW